MRFIMIIGQPQNPVEMIATFVRDQKPNKLISHFNLLGSSNFWWNGGRYVRPIYFHRKSIYAHAGSVIGRNFSVKTQGTVLYSVI